MSDIDPYADPTASAVSSADNEALQGPLDREILAAHFRGYELEPLITVALNPVELVTPPAGQIGEGGGA
jgi:hypothetical protein